jgi:hypothetical protein
MKLNPPQTVLWTDIRMRYQRVAIITPILNNKSEWALTKVVGVRVEALSCILEQRHAVNFSRAHRIAPS